MVNRKIILPILLIFQSVFAIGQNYRSAISIDFRPSVAECHVNIGNDPFDPRFSIPVGIEFKTLISKQKLFIEGGIFYSDKGYKSAITFTDNAGNERGTEVVKFKFHYLTVPINFIFQHKGFYAGAGVNGNYYLNTVILTGDTSRTQSNSTKYKNEFILGVQSIVGYEIKLSSRFLLGLGGFLELTFPLEDKFPQYNSDEEKYLNVGISARLIYALKRPDQ